jgi:hypothetical protein
VGHNVQSVVDGKHHLIAHIQIVQAGNDSRQLEPMARAALRIAPGKDRRVDIVADGGYNNSAQIARCEEDGMRAHVPARKETAQQQAGYEIGDFVHDAPADEYICPQGKRLRRHGDTAQKEIVYRVYYDTQACRGCPCLEQCTTGKYRKLKISPYREAEQEVTRRLVEQPEIYERRKTLAEHPFGTIKSIWGYGQFMVKGAEGCEGELNLIAFAYNWKRAVAVAGLKALTEALFRLIWPAMAATGRAKRRQ